MRWFASLAGLALAAVLVTACSSGTPWWTEKGASSCGPPALARVGGHRLYLGYFAGLFVLPGQAVTVHVGAAIDVHMEEEDTASGHGLVPVFPVPRSSANRVLTRVSVSADRPTATYRAERPGRVTLTSSSMCLRADLAHEVRGSCPVLRVTVVS